MADEPSIVRFGTPLFAFPALRATLWMSFLRSVAPSWLLWSAFVALLRGSADGLSLLVGGLASGSIHYVAHMLSGLVIVPGQARRTVWLLRFVQSMSLLDRINPGLRPSLGRAASSIEVMDSLRPAQGRALVSKLDGVRFRIGIPLTTSGGDADAIVLGAVGAPRPSASFRALARLGDGDDGASVAESVAGDLHSDDDSASLLRRAGGEEASPHVTRLQPVRVRGGASGAPLCVVYFGGNAEVWESLRECQRMLAQGCVVLAANYPGVGDSAGHCTASGMVLTGAACVDFAMRHMGFRQSEIVLFGHSIGGGVACELVKHFPGCHLIADRTFGRLADVAATIMCKMVSRDSPPEMTEIPLDMPGAAPLGGRFELGSDESVRRSLSPGIPSPPPSLLSWSQALRSTEGICRLVLLFVFGWELDTASGYKAMIVRERLEREKLWRSSEGGREATSVDRAVLAARAIPGIGKRLLIFSAGDRMIPLRVSLPFTLGSEGGGSAAVPPPEVMALPSVGSDQHNREFTDSEWARVREFLEQCKKAV
jgi:pimeloyl-ACP methyl ester carboxylesterase